MSSRHYGDYIPRGTAGGHTRISSMQPNLNRLADALPFKKGDGYMPYKPPVSVVPDEDELVLYHPLPQAGPTYTGLSQMLAHDESLRMKKHYAEAAYRKICLAAARYCNVKIDRKTQHTDLGINENNTEENQFRYYIIRQNVDAYLDQLQASLPSQEDFIRFISRLGKAAQKGLLAIKTGGKSYFDLLEKEKPAPEEINDFAQSFSGNKKPVLTLVETPIVPVTPVYEEQHAQPASVMEGMQARETLPLSLELQARLVQARQTTKKRTSALRKGFNEAVAKGAANLRTLGASAGQALHKGTGAIWSKVNTPAGRGTVAIAVCAVVAVAATLLLREHASTVLSFLTDGAQHVTPAADMAQTAAQHIQTTADAAQAAAQIDTSAVTQTPVAELVQPAAKKTARVMEHAATAKAHVIQVKQAAMEAFDKASTSFLNKLSLTGGVEALDKIRDCADQACKIDVANSYGLTMPTAPAPMPG